MDYLVCHGKYLILQGEKNRKTQLPLFKNNEASNTLRKAVPSLSEPCIFGSVCIHGYPRYGGPTHRLGHYTHPCKFEMKVCKKVK